MAIPCSELLRDGVNLFEEEVHVVADIGLPSSHGGSRYAYGPDEQLRL